MSYCFNHVMPFNILITHHLKSGLIIIKIKIKDKLVEEGNSKYPNLQVQ